MAKSKSNPSELVELLKEADSDDVVILLSDLRSAVGSDLSEMRKFTVSPYRDEYLSKDVALTATMHTPQQRQVRVHRESLLYHLAPELKPKLKEEPEPEKNEPEPEKLEAVPPAATKLTGK